MKREKLLILGCFMALSIYVIVVAARFPSPPQTLGSGFFPIFSACLLFGFSLIELILTLWQKGGAEPERAQNLPKILLVTAMLIAFVLLMRYMHPLAGIVLFLFAYLVLIAKAQARASVLISVAGTGIVYVAIRLLQIPL